MNLNKFIAGSLVAVSAVISADALARDWSESIVQYSCNGIQCTLPVSEEKYTFDAHLKEAKAKGYMFHGWNLLNKRCEKQQIKGTSNCNEIIWEGVSYNPMTVIPSEGDKLSWSKKDGFHGLSCAETCKGYFLIPSGGMAGMFNAGLFKASAIWDMIHYQLTVYLNGGQLDIGVLKSTTNPGDKWVKDYTILDNFKLPTPTKNGYTFGGWCTNQNLNVCSKTPNLYDEKANKVYYAKWEKGDGSSISSGFSGDFKPINNLKPVNPIKIKPIKLNK